MSEDGILRQDLRQALNDVRRLIQAYSGLYAGEDVVGDVLGACDRIAKTARSSPRFEEARRLVYERCAQLVSDADRFSMRDPASIARSRARALAAVDMLQDTLFDLFKTETRSLPQRSFLKRRSL